MTVSTKSKIIITRAEEDSAEMQTELEAQGLDVATLPCLEFIDPEDEYKGLDAAIRANHEYDWVIFLSQKAAERFFDRLLAIGGHLFNLAPSLKIACIGDSTRRFVQDQVGFPVNFVPSKFNSDVFLEEFGAELNKDDKVYNKILLPRTAMVNDDFVQQLRLLRSARNDTELESSLDTAADSSSQDTATVSSLRGAAEAIPIEVDLVHAYSTQCPQLTEEQKTQYREILNSEQKLKLTFTSSQIVRNFCSLVELTLSQDLTSWAQDNKHRVEVYSLGPKTSKTIRELFPHEDLKLYEATTTTIAGLITLVS